MKRLAGLYGECGYPTEAAATWRMAFDAEPEEGSAAGVLRSLAPVGTAAATQLRADWAWIGERLRRDLEEEPSEDLMAIYAEAAAVVGITPAGMSGARARATARSQSRPARPTPGGSSPEPPTVASHWLRGAVGRQ